MERKHEVADAFEAEEVHVPDIAKVEEETVAARRKELKSTPVDQLKRFVEAQGLDTGKKEDMVDSLAKHEAACRAEGRAHQDRIRKVLVDKKEELDSLSIPELKDRCAEAGIKGATLPKPARIEALLKQWQADDGVDKALTKIAHDAREQELIALGAEGLQRLCETAGVDPYVKEVMVDRIVDCEHLAGRFGRPVLDWQVKEAATPAAAAASVDMVEALMASEANRKRERELKRQEEEKEAKKKAELNALNLQDLKKKLAATGSQATGTKEELIEALLQMGKRMEAVAKRKADLKAMEPVELKKFLQSKALPMGEKKDEMIQTILAYETQVYESALTYNDKVEEALAQTKLEWEGKSTSELKELCVSQGLSNSGNKDACRERLFEALKVSGEADKVLAAKARSARVEQLKALSKEEALKICTSLSLSPFVKSIMVERLRDHEDAFGRIEEPKAKRARKTK